MKFNKILFFGFIFTCSIKAQVWISPIREIPINNLPDIAIASFDQFGPVIYYNPIGVQQAGPYAAAFFRAHEYGHHYLNHIQRKLFLSNPYNTQWLSIQIEKEADKYAFNTFRHNRSVLLGAIEAFEAQGYMTDGSHETGIQRAQNIKDWMNEETEEEEESTSEEVECNICNGEGIITKTSDCFACNGGGYLICAYCLGTGMVHDIYNITYICASCRGYGRLICTKCDGEGTVTTERNCWKCKGTGTVSKK